MKSVAIGGTGLSGSKLVAELDEHRGRIGNTRFDDWLRNARALLPCHDSHAVTEGSHA